MINAIKCVEKHKNQKEERLIKGIDYECIDCDGEVINKFGEFHYDQFDRSNGEDDEDEDVIGKPIDPDEFNEQEAIDSIQLLRGAFAYAFIDRGDMSVKFAQGDCFLPTVKNGRALYLADVTP